MSKKRVMAPKAIWHHDRLVSASDFGRDKFKSFISETSKFTQDQIAEIMKAYDFAKEAYKKGENGDIHRRETGEPFFDHGKGVFLIDFIEFGQRNIHTLIAELLHDGPEENKMNIFEIQMRFNMMVANIVLALTNAPKTGSEFLDASIKKFRFILMEMYTEISKAKVCDRLHNLRTPKCMDPSSDRFPDAVKWAYEQLIETIQLILPLAKSLSDTRYLEALKLEMKNLSLFFGQYFLPSDRAHVLVSLKGVLNESDWMECVQRVQPREELAL
jgi:(p)ppGpp synthase/HD superfamily hydrolase